jgi:NAD+ diphosphatase
MDKACTRKRQKEIIWRIDKMSKKYFFVFCKEDLLLEKTSDGSYTIPCGEEPPTEVKPWTHVMNITPMDDGTEVRTYRIDSPVTDSGRYEMCGLRQSFYQLPEPLYLKAGKCQELLYWDSNTKYCGVCGAPMRMDTDISKKCTECGKEIWPQLATAVIVLIHRGDEVLLVRAKNFKRDYSGLVAGFVETGETLEEAVAREAMEETGVTITNIRYFASQPWPYPCGIMIGFTADYVSGSIHLQDEELSRGAWFARDQMPEIPDKMSIARQLIDNWLNS